MSDTLIDDEETLLKHFVCDCGEIEHGMMVTVEWNEVIFSWYVAPLCLWRRLRHALEILIGRDDSYTEFILRKEDISELVGLLDKAKEERR